MNKRRVSTYKISLMDLPGQLKLIRKEIDQAIGRVLDAGWFIGGPEVTKFENDFAKYCSAKYCIGTGSGTDSLYLSLLALGIGAGDEVITVPNTFTATSEIIALVDAKIVFCDVDPKTFSMDPKKLEQKITKRTKAIIPVHLQGNPARMDEILKIAKKNKLFVIEDAAQAHGAEFKNKRIGSLSSTTTCFSSHPVKNLGAYGDAGSITTNNETLAKKLKSLSTHGRGSHHDHLYIGTTARLDAMQAAVLTEKLKYLDQCIKNKTKIANFYREHLPKEVQIVEIEPGGKSSYHIFAVLVKDREKLAKFLADNGIETGMHYPIALHLQPAYKFLGHKKGDFPTAEHYAASTLSLPLFPHMTIKQAEEVVSKIKEYYGQG